MWSNPHSSPEVEAAHKIEVSPEVEASLNSAVARMRLAAYHTIAEFYLLYDEYYLPVNRIICSYISHVKPPCKKQQVNLLLHLTSLTRAANPFMINEKIIFTFLMCMQVSFKLNSAKEQPSLQKEAQPGSQPHSQKGGRIQ